MTAQRSTCSAGIHWDPFGTLMEDCRPGCATITFVLGPIQKGKTVVSNSCSPARFGWVYRSRSPGSPSDYQEVSGRALAKLAYDPGKPGFGVQGLFSQGTRFFLFTVSNDDGYCYLVTGHRRGGGEGAGPLVHLGRDGRTLLGGRSGWRTVLRGSEHHGRQERGPGR